MTVYKEWDKEFYMFRAGDVYYEFRRIDGYLSIEDMQVKTKVTKAVIETLSSVGVLSGLPETSQMSLF